MCTVAEPPARGVVDCAVRMALCSVELLRST